MEVHAINHANNPCNSGILLLLFLMIQYGRKNKTCPSVSSTKKIEKLKRTMPAVFARQEHTRALAQRCMSVLVPVVTAGASMKLTPYFTCMPTTVRVVMSLAAGLLLWPPFHSYMIHLVSHALQSLRLIANPLQRIIEPSGLFHTSSAQKSRSPISRVSH